MTPEEKGKELVQKFRILVGTYEGDEGEPINNYLTSKSTAKKAALICCDEILDALGWSPHPDHMARREYWKQVKAAIQQL